jgi:hypothetical protein
MSEEASIVPPDAETVEIFSGAMSTISGWLTANYPDEGFVVIMVSTAEVEPGKFGMGYVTNLADGSDFRAMQALLDHRPEPTSFVTHQLPTKDN